MGKYTARGSADFDAVVDAHLRRIVTVVDASMPSQQMLGMVLLGGYGRQEGTPLKKEGKEVPFNDYDLVVVAKPLSRKQRYRLQEGLMEVGQRLTKELGVEVDLFVHTLNTLQHCEPSLLNYEMLHGHKVVHGGHDLLRVMPSLTLANVPMEEGTRLLLNRGKLLLDIKRAFESNEEMTQERHEIFSKFIWKNHLAFGDCVLLAHRKYSVSYELKARSISAVAEDPSIPNAQWMVERYLEAIEFKHEGKMEMLTKHDLKASYEQSLQYFLRFFLWYEGQRLDCECANTSAYYSCLPQQSLSFRERLEALIKNVRHLSAYAASPSWQWALIHPRHRLFVALHLLLGPQSHDSQALQLVGSLLGSSGNEHQLVQRFLNLRMKLS